MRSCIPILCVLCASNVYSELAPYLDVRDQYIATISLPFADLFVSNDSSTHTCLSKQTKQYIPAYPFFSPALPQSLFYSKLYNMSSSQDTTNPAASSVPLTQLNEELRKVKRKHIHEVLEMHVRGIEEAIGEIAASVEHNKERLEEKLRELRESPYFAQMVEEYKQKLTEKDIKGFADGIEAAMDTMLSPTDEAFYDVVQFYNEKDEK